MIVNTEYLEWRVRQGEEGIADQYERERTGLISAESRATNVNFYRRQMTAAQNLPRILNNQPID